LLAPAALEGGSGEITQRFFRLGDQPGTCGRSTQAVVGDKVRYKTHQSIYEIPRVSPDGGEADNYSSPNRRTRSQFPPVECVAQV
jgi:hypothetical protein